LYLKTKIFVCEHFASKIAFLKKFIFYTGVLFLTEGATAAGTRFWRPNGSGTENCALLLRKPALILKFLLSAACLAVTAVISRSSSDSKIGTPAEVKNFYQV
jgi:hypothetical protein